MAFLNMRVVTPEILDTLDPCHPDALRSRRDLRRLDHFLGGSRWIVRMAARHRTAAASGVIELGAGDGRLCNALSRRLPCSRITGLDLVAPGCPPAPGVRWRSGDFFRTLPDVHGGVVVGSLILHHFDQDALLCLGEMLRTFRVLLFSEPLRHPWPLLLSEVIRPLVGTVTRHDMPASIRAGFRPGELARLLGLADPGWTIAESSRACGVLRFEAWRD